MSIKETIVKDKKFRVCTDPAKDEWDRVSFWTASTDVEMADGTDLETKMDSLVVQGGITDVQKSVWDNMSIEEKEAGNFCVIYGEKYTLYIKNHEVSSATIVQVTQEQWDAMSPEQRKSGVFYIPGGSGVIDASAVAMDPTGTIFIGDNVEVALRNTSDELEKLNTNVKTNTSNITLINDNLTNVSSSLNSFENTVIADDANNARETGFYHLYGSALNNPVSGAGGTLIVMHPKSYKDGEYIRQIAVMNTSDMPNNFRVFVRMTNGEGTWGEWVQFASKSMVDSKVNKAGDTITGSLILSKTTDASGTADNSPALIVGGTRTTAHIEMDGNEIMAKSNGTTPSGLGLNNEGGKVTIGKDGGTDHLYVNSIQVPVGVNKGSATQPTYVDANGNVTACSGYLSGGNVTTSGGVYNGSSFNFNKFASIKILRTTIKVSNGATTTWTEVGKIPSGYEPSFNQYFSTPINANVVAKIRLEANGNISLRTMANYTSTSTVENDTQFVYF